MSCWIGTERTNIININVVVLICHEVRPQDGALLHLRTAIQRSCLIVRGKNKFTHILGSISLSNPRLLKKLQSRSTELRHFNSGNFKLRPLMVQSLQNSGNLYISHFNWFSSLVIQKFYSSHIYSARKLPRTILSAKKLTVTELNCGKVSHYYRQILVPNTC